jgi:DNA-binding HxlR family transcriptional regulator
MVTSKPRIKSRNTKKKKIRGKGWKKSIKVAQDKYDVISKAILKVLTKKPMRFSELVAKVKKQVPGFPGSVSWYTVTTLRDLESIGKVIRTKGKPVTYQKP